MFADGSNVKVEKVISAVDIGPVINMSGAKNQVEGAVVDALSTAQLEITFADGAAQQGNFNDYPLLRIDQAPEVEVHFIQSDNSPSGLGEPPFAPATPAIANAIFAATGTRICHCPGANLKLGSGIADVPGLLQAGCRRHRKGRETVCPCGNGSPPRHRLPRGFLCCAPNFCEVGPPRRWVTAL